MDEFDDMGFSRNPCSHGVTMNPWHFIVKMIEFSMINLICFKVYAMV